jgi:hypothetical protein
MTTTEDRERTRNQLQGLAQLAKQVSPDSSGYVDLSAFSSSDAPTYAWVDQALSHSRGSEPPKIDRLDSDSMRPVALESLLDPQEVGGAKTARLQKAFIIASSVCIAGLAVAAIALAIRSPDAPARASSAVAASVVAVAAAAPAPVPAADPPAVTPPGQAAAPVPVADSTTLAPQAPQGTPGSSKHTTTKKKLVAPAAGSRVHTRGSASASSSSSNAWLGAGGTGGAKKSGAAGGDSLMGAIQQSFAAPKK